MAESGGPIGAAAALENRINSEKGKAAPHIWGRLFISREGSLPDGGDFHGSGRSRLEPGPEGTRHSHSQNRTYVLLRRRLLRSDFRAWGAAGCLVNTAITISRAWSSTDFCSFAETLTKPNPRRRKIPS